MKLNEINIRDPYILLHEGKYYLFGTKNWGGGKVPGFDCYISEDLENFSKPVNAFSYYEGFMCKKEFWAPEVHFYNGKFYMLASFRAEGHCRGTHILVSDTPDGTFVPVSDVPATPLDWECLDGTLYIDKQGDPHLVFCHEWLQIGNGAVCEVKLSRDLSRVLTEPRVLWSAADHPGVAETWKTREGAVTDGPFLFRCENGELLSIWSSFTAGDYSELIARSDNGDIDGNWIVQVEPLSAEGGGHGMIFRTFAGEKKFIMHRPNSPAGAERPVLMELWEEKGNLRIG